ncbi:hypothetical protein AHMF7605_10405 [Adhaeribacter arboris]|uniref:Uncharacterized protein n=1 Tax=Adhaeribacter arboris TaxID=2072846 RepID=A0A2T2YEG2_9BACT|nr:hypothetical protein [Adhaeribacter arboris]PSR53899.1 hypothetical protein AHMF7605_10405 [Adhaeribacter arboris]
MPSKAAYRQLFGKAAPAPTTLTTNTSQTIDHANTSVATVSNSSNVTYTFSNPEFLWTATILASGAGIPTISGSTLIGDGEYDPARNNRIDIECLNPTGPVYHHTIINY